MPHQSVFCGIPFTIQVREIDVQVREGASKLVPLSNIINVAVEIDQPVSHNKVQEFLNRGGQCDSIHVHAEIVR